MKSQLELDLKRKELLEILKLEWGANGKIENMTGNAYGSEIYDIEKRYRQGKNYTPEGSLLYNTLKKRCDELQRRFREAIDNKPLSVKQLEDLRFDLFTLKKDMLQHAQSSKPTQQELFDKNSQKLAQEVQVKSEVEHAQPVEAAKEQRDMFRDATNTQLDMETKRDALISIIVQEWGSGAKIRNMTWNAYSSNIYDIEKKNRKDKNYSEEGSQLYREVTKTCSEMVERFKVFESNPKLSIGALEKLRNELLELHIRMNTLAGYSERNEYARQLFDKNNEELANWGKPKPKIDPQQEKIASLTKSVESKLNRLGSLYADCKGDTEAIKKKLAEEKEQYSQLKKGQPSSYGDHYYHSALVEYPRRIARVEDYLSSLAELELAKSEAGNSSSSASSPGMK